MCYAKKCLVSFVFLGLFSSGCLAVDDKDNKETLAQKRERLVRLAELFEVVKGDWQYEFQPSFGSYISKKISIQFRSRLKSPDFYRTCAEKELDVGVYGGITANATSLQRLKPQPQTGY